MKRLLVIEEQDIEPSAPIVDTSSFNTREASRGVVLNEEGEVYLLKVNVHNYHKLPGGGIDEGEDKVAAMKRECIEEIGCTVSITAELGMIIEYRNQFKLIQTSYCYLARQEGPQGESSLEEGEIAEGLEEVRVASIDEAIRALSSDKPDNYEGKFIQKRDLTVLYEAKKELHNEVI